VHGGTILAVRPANTRSAVTNDPRRLSADCDKRSFDGRLFCDLYDSVAAEFPGADGSQVRQIALLRFELEKARASGTLTLEDTVRMSHLIERRERALRLTLRQHQTTQPAEGLRDRLGSKYGVKGAAP
jgi:hypothetical protein